MQNINHHPTQWGIRGALSTLAGLVPAILLALLAACAQPLATDTSPPATDPAAATEVPAPTPVPPDPASQAAFVRFKPADDGAAPAFAEIKLGTAGTGGLVLERLESAAAVASGAAATVAWCLLDELPFRDRLKPGDLLRVWSGAWSGSTDAAEADNTPGVWDVRAGAAAPDDGGGAAAGLFRLATAGHRDDQVAWLAEGGAIPTWLVQELADGQASTPALPDSAIGLVDGSAAGTFFGLVDGRSRAAAAADWVAVEPASLTISGLIIDPAVPEIERDTTIRLEFQVAARHLGGEPHITVDATSLGVGDPVSCTDAGSGRWVASLPLAANVAPGEHTVTIKAVAAGQTALGNEVRANMALDLPVLPPRPCLELVSADWQAVADETAVNQAIQGDNLHLRLLAQGRHGATVDEVRADLSGLGGAVDQALAAETAADGTAAWGCDLSLPAALPPGNHAASLRCFDHQLNLEQDATLNLLVRKSDLAFEGGDMETDMQDATGLKPANSTAYQAGTGMDGSRALHLSGTMAANDFLFRSAAVLGPPPPGTTKISFRIRGTISGKGLSVQLGPLGSSAPGDIFSGGVIGAVDKSIDSRTSHSYTGSVDTAGLWVKVSLNLVARYGDGRDSNLAGGLSLKTGAGAVCDAYLDDFCWE